MTGALAATTMAKVRRRLLPFMFILYMAAYLDRINVGFAALQMNAALHFSDAVYGFGAGIFFVGYFLFEVPSNLILHRVGARRWIARIMITWGAVSAAMALTTTPAVFYALRFLLGLAEAGFFPGMLLYLTQWFPERERAHAVALFMTATAVAGVIGSPISGALLGISALGLAGWQWLFILEGVPAVLLGFVVLRHLTDAPRDARWLADSERAWLEQVLHGEAELTGRAGASQLRQALLSPYVWRFCLVYFALVTAMYGVGFWLPQIVRGASGASAVRVGVLSALPYAVAALSMVLVGRNSDRTGERRWHATASCVAAAIGLTAATATASPAWSLLWLCVGAAGIWSALAPTWALPMARLTGTAAAGGLALINSLGNLGGFVGPNAVGLVRQWTGRFDAGLWVLGGSLLAGALLVATSGEVPRRQGQRQV